MMTTSVPVGIYNYIRRVSAAIAQPLNCGINFWGAETLDIDQSPDTSTKAPIKISVHHPGVLRELVLKHDPIVLFDAYLNGYLDINGDLEELITMCRSFPPIPLTPWQKFRFWTEAIRLPPLPSLDSKDAQSRHVAESPEHDREAIRHHYDLGNDFYQLWLDPHWVYTCAHYEQPDMSLADAQEAKLDLICRKLRLQPGETLLDVGCGWGSLLRWAAKHYGVKGYGITLSEEQVRLNQKFIAEEGLGDRLQVELRHYCELPAQPTFDKIVAIGIIEHVGQKNYPLFFNRMMSLLKPGGLFLNHGITATREGHGKTLGERFINRYFFPNGDLVRISTILTAMEDAGLEIVDLDAWRPHYAKTLRHWAEQFDCAIDQIVSFIDDRHILLWHLYFMGCALGFENNAMGLYQVLARRQCDRHWNLPLTRDGWLC